MSGLADLSYAKNWEFDPEVSGQGDVDRSRIAAAEEWVVRERWFIGSLSFRVGEAIYEYGRTPLLDFSMSLRYALNLLAADGDSTLVAEGGSEIHLSLDGRHVESRRRGSDVVGVAEFVDLAKVSAKFMREFIDDCTRLVPDLLLNDSIERIYRESGARELGRDRFLRHSRAVSIRNSMGLS
ncbi:hypothetical protein [Streptomyces sp. NK08204]|uniref:hypothetical protein n=1 Tax=Streptomyces sp. NK08204 TaxID=2873260 RepID=UPI001CED5CC3|nr:hypothetical protein [Streptomyces sp. NK08204]